MMKIVDKTNKKLNENMSLNILFSKYTGNILCFLTDVQNSNGEL